MASDIEKKSRQDCLDFIITAVQHLQSNLSYEVHLLQCSQYIHSDKRNTSESLSAISSLAIKTTLVLNNNNYLPKVFSVKNVLVDSFVDQVCSQ